MIASGNWSRGSNMLTPFPIRDASIAAGIDCPRLETNKTFQYRYEEGGLNA